jgi:hypothetical protein
MLVTPMIVVYTQEFNPKLVDKILEEHNTDPDPNREIEFIVESNGSFGNFTLGEFRDLSIKELEAKRKDMVCKTTNYSIGI